MKTTIREVSKLAIVSLGTVSKVLNAHPSVRPETVKRVNEAIRQLNYVPLRRRGGMLSRPTGGAIHGQQVGLLLLGMERSLVEVPTVAEVVQSTQSALCSAGATVILVDVANPQFLPPCLLNGELAGLLIKGSLQGDVLSLLKPELRDRLERLPTVWLAGRPAGSWGDAIVADVAAETELVVDHLAERGHRSVAVLNPKQQHPGFRGAANAFRDQSLWRGLTVRQFVTAAGGNLPQRPVEDIQALVDQALTASPAVTALYCPSSNLARLVYRALAVRGRRIGVDISVLSSGHEPEANSALHPSLTTVDHGTAVMGPRAVEVLTWRLAHPAERPINLSIVPRLVPGESVADLRG